MSPIPDESQDNPSDNDPNHSESEDLETPNHVIPPTHGSSSDDDDDFDSEAEGPANDGYVLLPQDPGEENGGGDLHHQPQPFPPPSSLDPELLPSEPMTEVRGAGIDLSEAVAQGNVHPSFAANFPENRVPVHLQVPNPPKAKKEEVLWNQTAPQHLHMDSAHASKVKSAMAGFQLPAANIPDWVKHMPEDQWKQQLVNRAFSPATGKSNQQTQSSERKPATSAAIDASCISDPWPGDNGT